MPLVIPRYLQARDLLSASVSTGTMTTTITWATATELSLAGTGTGTWKAFEFTGNPQLAQFMPSDASVANYQNEFDDWEFTAREITPANGSGTFTAAWTTKDYFRFDYVYRPREIGTGAGTRLVVVGIRSTLKVPLSTGENVQEVTIRPIGWPVYVGLSTATPPF